MSIYSIIIFVRLSVSVIVLLLMDILILVQLYNNFIFLVFALAVKRNKGPSGALSDKMLLVRIIQNNNIDAYFREGLS